MTDRERDEKAWAECQPKLFVTGSPAISARNAFQYGRETARAEERERCVGIVRESIVAECVTGPTHYFCDEYGCGTLRSIIAQIKRGE